MKAYWFCLKHTWVAVLFGTIAGCAIIAIPHLLFGFATVQKPFENLGVIFGRSAVFISIGALICLPFGLIFGAPIGAWLFHRGWANPWTAGGVGCVPGFGWWALASDPGALVFPLLFGVPVALSTYDFARRRLVPPTGANDST